MQRRNFQPKPILTYSIIVINLVIFLIAEGLGASRDIFVLLDLGVKYNPLIISGEYWRFITPIFLHFGLMHIGMNTFSLFMVGPAVESIFGRWRFAVIYFGSGMVGVFASFVFVDTLSAGASGAIFGLVGALLFIAFKQREFGVRIHTQQIVLIVLLNLVIGFTASGIDNAAHIGGMVGGFLFAMAVSIRHYHYLSRQVVGAFLVIIVSVSLLMKGFSQPLTEREIELSVGYAMVQAEKGDYEKAERYLEPLMNIDDPLALMAIGRVKLGQKQYREAESYLEQAVVNKGNQLNKERLSLAFSWLADAYWLTGQADQTIEAVEEAIALNPNEEGYKKQLDFYQEAKKEKK